MKIINNARFAILNSAYSYIGKAVSSIFLALAFVLIVRELAIVDYGRYTFYINSVFFVTVLLNFGMAEVILRYVPEYAEEKSMAEIKWLLKMAVMLVVGVCSACVFIAVIFTNLFPELALRFGLKGILPYIAVFGCLRVTCLMFGNILNALLLQSYRITWEIIISLLKLALIYFLLKFGADVWALIILYGLLDLLFIFIFFLKIRRPLELVSVKPSPGRLWRLRRYAINEYLYKLFWFFTDNRFDLYLVGIMLGLTAAGYYAFAAGVVNVLVDWSPALIIRPVIAPLFIKIYSSRKDIGQLQYLFRLHSKFLVFITLPVFLSIALLFDKVIIYIFSPKYLPSLNVFFIFIASMFLGSILTPLRNIISIMERTDISNFTNIVAIPKIALILFLAKRTGIHGVALIYAFSILAIIWINKRMISKVIALEFPWKGFVKIGVNSGVMAVFLCFFRPLVVGKLSLFLVFLGAAIIYAASAFVNKAFDKEERDLFNSALKVKAWFF